MESVLTRRNFLKTTGGTTLAVSLAGWQGMAVEKSPVKRKLKKAVNLGMVQGNQSVLEKFKLLKDLGFDGVELNRPGGPPVMEILKARDATGLLVGNVLGTGQWEQPLSDPKPNVRARGLKAIEQALQDAKQFDCTTVLVVPAVVNKQVSYADAYTQSQAGIRKAIPLAEKLGVRLCIENVWNNFLLSPLEAARYVDEFKSESVGWHFDVGNIVHYGWPEQWIHVLGQRIGNLHIKEFSRAQADKKGKWAGFNVELLEGDNDWPAVMKALDDIGYTGWAVAEIPGGDTERLQAIAKQMDKIFTNQEKSLL